MEEILRLERQGRIVLATLSRPPVNALDEDLIARLEAVLARVVADEDVRVLHLRSDQKVFCAGADLALMRASFATAAGLDAMMAVVGRMQRLFAGLETAPLTTVAEIGGAALGGGLELALACDVRIAAAEARLGLPEARLGLIPGAGGTQRLSRLCGSGTARRMILGAELVDGAEAERLGLVQWARPAGEVASWTREIVARFAEIPRAALVAGKRCLAAVTDASLDGFAEELASTRRLYGDPETRRRVSDFLERPRSRAQTGADRG